MLNADPGLLRRVLQTLGGVAAKVFRAMRALLQESSDIQPGARAVQLFGLDQAPLTFEQLNAALRVLDSRTLGCDALQEFARRYAQLLKMHRTRPEAFEHFRLCVEDGAKLRLMCLSASVGFRPFLKTGQKATVLMSGTLRPFELLEAKLGTRFESKVVVAPDSEKWQRQLFFSKLSGLFHFWDKPKLRYTFGVRSNAAFHRGCVRFISEIAKTTSEGVLVFLPSYAVLELFRKTVAGNLPLKKALEKTGRVFFEKKGAPAERMLGDFKVRL